MPAQEAIWLHISDFHFKAGDPYDRDVVLNAFLKSLPNLIDRSGRPDFVVASGDIANSGQPAEYEAATAFFDKLLSILELAKDRLIVVPGNHDIDRKAGRGIIRTLSPDEADAYFDPSEEFIHIGTRLRAFAAWHDTYFDGIRALPRNSTCAPNITLSLPNGVVDVLAINTAVFCFDDNDHGKLWVGRRSLSAALDESSLINNRLKIAVMHHPLNWLAASEAANIKAALRAGVDCILSGHLHETDIEQVAGVYGGATHLSAGAMYQTRNWPNTAMMVSWSKSKLVVTPFRYEDTPSEIWTIDPSIFSKNPDFKGHYNLDRLGSEIAPSPSSANLVDVGEPADPSIATIRSSSSAIQPKQAESDLQQDLFLTPSGKPLFAEPRLMTSPIERADHDDSAEELNIDRIVSSRSSFLIESRSEYGGSTLCRLIASRLSVAGAQVFRKDARELQAYRKKLEADFHGIDVNLSNVLILDNFDPERHERLFRELNGTGWFSRYIILVQNRTLSPVKSSDISNIGVEFEHVYLWTQSRSGIRLMAAELFQSRDDLFISSIVDKVYEDLLRLCIPLTPSNIVMYLRILHREGEFHPLNRVDIVGRYVSEMLRRPSDAYGETFTGKNKVDLLCSFTYQMYLDKVSSFDRRYWTEFSTRYQKETLTDFDTKALLNEALEARIFLEIGSTIFHKYSFFYSYLLGKYISNRTDALAAFLTDEEYLRVPGVVDVISGVSADNTSLVKALTDKLQEQLTQFDTKYFPRQFDPLAGALWPTTEGEDEKLWKPIAAQIEAGPKPTSEIDEVKTSLLAEKRTATQEVSLAKYSQLESALFECTGILIDALRNADDVQGDLKLRALEAILQARHVIFQVGSLLAPALASERYYQWGGIAYLNFNKVGGDPDSPQAKLSIIDTLSYSVAKQTAEILGTRKLAGVFRAEAEKVSKIGFVDIMLFHLVVNARGVGWEDTARELIKKAPRESFFLCMMSDALTEVGKHEILQLRDRSSFKQLISIISANRTYKKEMPGAKAVARRMRFLDKKGYLEELVGKSTD
ncbi:metallophosphoesterase family protein [Sphingomonas sp. CFBP 13706]|uniref:metallophosphoesterase family protein n=1 Tax=Sphingomonas sp. CFBP 13706 TaxID=2775314 RepID=UPI0017868BDC|nr:metallophosphoesterase [Sphingomonas sp. CFBP 13706]MBD8737609.1 metallophosphoesterase [Sphingomonas sp. CFBP 13706]